VVSLRFFIFGGFWLFAFSVLRGWRETDGSDGEEISD
jgi:hypothetical protein